jgi:hypothetical protein
VPATYTVTDGTPVTINGQSGTLSAITTGSMARIKLSAVDGTKVVSIDVYNARTGGEWGQQRGQRSQFASVVSTDTTANTVTVTSPFGGQSTQTTYNVSPTATITIDGAASALGQLTANVPVILRTDPADATTVTSITAVGREVEGRVTAVDTTNSTITLAGRGGAAGTTYTLGPSATITVNGATGTLAQVIAGATAELRLSALDGTTVISMHASSAMRDGWGWTYGGLHMDR